MRAQAAHSAPVVSETACIFGEQSIVSNSLEDPIQIVRNRSEKARRELRAQCPRVKEGWCGTHEIEGGEKFVELDRLCIAVDFTDSKSHRHPHEECLRQLIANAILMQEVPIVQS